MSYKIDCSKCQSRCDGKSKCVYNFESDAEYSEHKEQEVIDAINRIDGFTASKCTLPGYPDIEVHYGDNIFYIEIKAQRRTFMSVQRLLKSSDLIPSETVALNLSDLKRYFDIEKNDGKKVYLMWCLENRPCIVSVGKTKFFYQSSEALKGIYEHYLDKRRFRRGSGKGDVVNGQHKGVVVNYHFSLDELVEADAGSGFIDLLRKGLGVNR